MPLSCRVLLAAILGVFGVLSAGAEGGPTTLLVVMDGLRPDYVTAEIMPNLNAFAEANIRFNKHHAVYPTVTRVNASTMVTGCYPGAHGLMDNSVYFPEVDPNKALSAADRGNLERIEAATGGKLLLVPTLGEILADAGKSLFVASSGSTGSAFLLNHKVKAGAIVHPEFVLPESFAARAAEVLDPAGPEATPNKAWNARVTDAYLKLGVDELKAPVAILWYTDPDHTAHEKGIGEPVTIESLKAVDAEFGRVLAGLEERGLAGKINIIISSDHGFSTGKAAGSYNEFINKYCADKGIDPASVVRAGYGLYFKDDAKKYVEDLVMQLQTVPWIGAIFTTPMFPGAPWGVNPGCASLGAVYYENPRNAHIVVSPDWSDDANEFGFKGTTTAAGHGHGSSSPWDVHNTLIAGGPGFKAGLKVDVPSGNIDLAPTILRLNGLPQVASMQGRVLEEALQGGADPASIEVKPQIYRQQMSIPGSEPVTYTLEIHESRVGATAYFDFAKATRTKGETSPGQVQFLPVKPSPTAAPKN